MFPFLGVYWFDFVFHWTFAGGGTDGWTDRRMLPQCSILPALQLIIILQFRRALMKIGKCS